MLMKIYALYQDDGPVGIVPQSCNVMCPAFQLHVFNSQAVYEEWKNQVLKNRSRIKPRIIFTLEDFEDNDGVVFYHYDLGDDYRTAFIDMILLLNKTIKNDFDRENVVNLIKMAESYIEKYVNKG